MKMNVVWIITLKNFEDDMWIILSSYTYIEHIFNNILSILYIEDVSIKYMLRKEKLYFKFDYNNKSINIILDWSKIENIFVWDSISGLLKTPTDYKNIEKYLNKIKN
jgi:hypothetical protein